MGLLLVQPRLEADPSASDLKTLGLSVFRHIAFILRHLRLRLQCAIELIVPTPRSRNTGVNEIGGADDSRHSTRANARSTLTFWPLLQRFSRTREGFPFGRHCIRFATSIGTPTAPP